MSYIIYRAVRKLWLHKKVYFFLLIELVLGISIILCGFHSSICATQRLETYQAQNAFGLDFRANVSGDQTIPAITVQDYQAIRQKYFQQGTFSYMILKHAIYTLTNTENVQNITIVSMSDTYFEDFFGFTPQPNTAYLGQKIQTDYQNGMMILADKVGFEGDSFHIGAESFLTDFLPKDARSLTLTAEVEFDQDTQSMIVLPEEQLDLLEQYIESSVTVFFRVTPFNENSTGFIYNIVDWLQNEHSGYQYQVIDQREQMEKSIQDLTSQIQQLAWFAQLALVITVIGIIGVLLIFLEHRRRELAICRMVGATKITLFLELFWEIFLLCLTGGILSFPIALIVIPHLSTSVFIVTFQWKSILVMLGIVAVIALLSCSCAIATIRSHSPLKILRS